VKVAILFLSLLVAGSTAAAQELILSPSQRAREMRPERYPRLQPIPFFYRETWVQEQNYGPNGRKNATWDEQRIAETPSLQPRPLTDDW